MRAIRKCIRENEMFFLIVYIKESIEECIMEAIDKLCLAQFYALMPDRISLLTNSVIPIFSIELPIMNSP